MFMESNVRLRYRVRFKSSAPSFISIVAYNEEEGREKIKKLYPDIKSITYLGLEVL